MKRSIVFKEVIRDFEARDELGWKEYGGELTPNTYDDPLQQAYEEALDLAVYLKCELMKRKEG